MSLPIWKIKSFEELSVEELYQIIRLRIEVFIIEQNTPYQDCDDTDQKALHIWAEIDGEIAVYARIFDRNIKYKDAASIGRVITREKYRKRSLANVLMTLSIETILNRYTQPDIRISAQNYLLNFYGKFGFVPVGETYLEDNLSHTEMFRKA